MTRLCSIDRRFLRLVGVVPVHRCLLNMSCCAMRHRADKRIHFDCVCEVICCIFSFQQSNMYLTSQKRSQNDAGHVEVYFILLSMFSNLFHVMKQARWKGTSSKMSISRIDPKARQSDPSTVDMRTHKPIHRNNSP